MNHIRHIIGWLLIVASMGVMCFGICYGITEDRAFHARIDAYEAEFGQVDTDEAYDEADEVYVVPPPPPQGFSMAYVVTIISCIIAFIPLFTGVLMVRRGMRMKSKATTNIITN